MPTPTNSVLTRNMSEEARLSQLIYENESLKIEVESLREQLESTDAFRIEDLRQSNEQLRIENTQLKVQLEEKTGQLGLLQNSDTRFSNIDDSLKQLLQRVQSQHEELTELKMVGKEKDDKVIELRVLLSKAEAQVAEEQTQHEERQLKLREDCRKLEEEKSEMEKALADEMAKAQNSTNDTQEMEAQIKQKDERIRRCEEEILSLKEAAAAKSYVRGDRATAQEKQIADLEQREVVSQEKIVSLENDLASLRDAVARAKEGASAMKKECDQRLAEAEATARLAKERAVAETAAAAAAAPTRSTQEIDFYSPEVKAYVAKKVNDAVADRDRRLREQVDENAKLLSRMALLQHESEAMVKKAGLSGRDVNAMNERVEAMSKVRGQRNVMERRVADLLSSDTLSKEDVQLVLQDMLDYQERAEEDISTRLLIKDMQAEEAEKTFRWNLKRVTNENTSLLKQLQKAAYASLQRQGRVADVLSSDGAPVSNSGSHMDDSLATLHPAGTPPPRAPAPAIHSGSHATDFATGHAAIAPVVDIVGGGAATATTTTVAMPQPLTTVAPSTDFHQPPWAPPPQQHRRGQQVHFQDPTAAPHPAAQYGGAHRQQSPPSPPPPLPSTAMPTEGMVLDPNRHCIVPCPACTYEQRFGNGRCELCETPLVLHRS